MKTLMSDEKVREVIDYIFKHRYIQVNNIYDRPYHYTIDADCNPKYDYLPVHYTDNGNITHKSDHAAIWALLKGPCIIIIPHYMQAVHMGDYIITSLGYGDLIGVYDHDNSRY